MPEDFYQILEVAKTASQDEIRSAYKKMAMKYHPDRNQDKKAECEAKLKKINGAYDVLKDPEKRANYDRFGSADGGGGFGGGRSGGGGSGFSGFEDIFDDINSMFTGGRRQKSSSGGGQKGSDLRYTLRLTLAEVFSGAKKKISFRALGKCPDCNGKGGEGVVSCSECNGHGSVRYQQGFFVIENTCPKCQGEGRLVKNPCKKCKGSGRAEKELNIDVDIPKGVADGDNIRMSGMGEAGVRGGASGDLFIAIKVEKHEFFAREGNDLYCEVPVRFTKAILGGSIDIPLIDGATYNLKISSGVQNGDRIRVGGKGLPRYNSSSVGDMYVIVKIETPVNLSSDQLKLVEQLDGMLKDESHPNSNKFFNKIKNLFK